MLQGPSSHVRVKGRAKTSRDTVHEGNVREGNLRERTFATGAFMGERSRREPLWGEPSWGNVRDGNLLEWEPSWGNIRKRRPSGPPHFYTRLSFQVVVGLILCKSQATVKTHEYNYLIQWSRTMQQTRGICSKLPSLRAHPRANTHWMWLALKLSGDEWKKSLAWRPIEQDLGLTQRRARPWLNV